MLRILLATSLLLTLVILPEVPAQAHRPATPQTIVDAWSPLDGNSAPYPRMSPATVWTGSEMLVWGGQPGGNSTFYRTGALYHPGTNTWRALSSAPSGTQSYFDTTVWTGSELLVWNPGGAERYNPTTDSWRALSSVGQPTNGDWHTAIWTGSEMLIWGGYAAGGYPTTGGRYDPATDTWTQIPAAPIAGRFSHSVVWTGTEMIIWGGYDNITSVTYGDGARYNPTTNTWTVMSMINAPSPQDESKAVWTGSEMVIWGTDATGGRYNPATDTWTPMSVANAPNPRRAYWALWTGSEMVIWGGYTYTGPVYYNTGARYNPSTDTWTPMSTTNAPSGRFWYGQVWTGTEMIVWGGGGAPIQGTTASRLYSGGRYNPQSDTWTATATVEQAPLGTTDFVSAWTGSEMLVWGGETEADSGQTLTNRGYAYNPNTHTWRPFTLTGAPAPREKALGVWTGTELIVWGGAQGNTCLTDGARYNLQTDSWTPMTNTNAPQGRCSGRAVWTGSKMIVWGGYAGPGLNTGGVYDPVADTWQATTLTNAPSARQDHSLVWTGSEMIVWAGYGATGTGTSGARYDPTTDTWIALPNTTGNGRSRHEAVWSGTEMIVWGGMSSLGTSNNTVDRYNPSTNTWVQAGSTGAPGTRMYFTAVWTGAEMVVWGGQAINTSNIYTNSGGIYNPTTNAWQILLPPAQVTKRAYHTALWTGSEMLVWGGHGDIPPRTTSDYYPSGWRYRFILDPVARIFLPVSLR